MAIGFTTGGTDFDNQFIRREFFQEGQLYVSGQNNYGVLGTNNSSNYSSPVQTIAGGLNWKSITTARQTAAGIKTDGTLWLWGRNDYGQLGINDVSTRSSPVQTISAGNTWKQVSSTWWSVGAIKSDGTLWMWGNNGTGQLGDNTTTHRSSPVQTVAVGTTWKQVSAGAFHSGAIKTDGTLWMWGNNGSGQLGTGDSTRYLSPVQTISSGTNWKQVACGYSTLAIKTDGTLWGWGYNGFGQLGTDNRTDRNSPVQTISGGTNWKQVSAGYYSSGAIKTDGTLWMWGYNNYGHLGTNDTTDRSSPVQTIAGGTNWKTVSVGSYSSDCAAIKTDGTLWGWGGNTGGPLRDGTATNRSSPVQMGSLNNWGQVSTGDFYIVSVSTVT